ncbi:MAG: M48 family metalloprotease [Pseudomonadota bacterium]|nr:M48 family metalloprotease [Pseudomonadota bacterium]
MKHCRHPPHILSFVLAIGISASAHGQPFQYQWRVSEIAAADADVVQLGTKRVKAIHTVRTDQMRLLYAVKTGIEEAAELDVILIIVDGDLPNAFAGKGQRSELVIGINFAMLEILGGDPHAAAALIGHEIAHLKLEHGESQKAKTATTGILSVIGGVVLSGLGVPGGQTISSLTFAAIQSGYSRDNEREADYLGTIWAVEAGFEADGGARLHEAMNRIPGASSTSFFSTHPSGPERVATLRALAARLSRVP